MKPNETVSRSRARVLTAAATTVRLAPAMLAPAALAADTQILLVHGHGAATKGKDCNGGTWASALRYYQDAGGRKRSSLTTIGYYPGDKGRCDVMIGDGKASNERPIQDIARDRYRISMWASRSGTRRGTQSAGGVARRGRSRS